LNAGPIGVVLAGGPGTRLRAGRLKALAVLGGETLLARAVRTLSRCAPEVLIAAPAALALPAGPTARVDDPPGGAGPLAGIVAAARARPRGGALVLGVDFPCVEAELIESLAARLGAREAVIPECAGRPQPLVAVYSAAGLLRMVAAFERGERAVTRASAALDADRPDERVFPGLGAALLNVNTPEDLAAAAAALAGRRATREE
jgi:molybdopterin-guanine dinucleotide biosynthesis protein A